MDTTPSGDTPREISGGRPSRVPLTTRKAAQRVEARRRIAAFTRVPLAAETLARDPLPRQKTSAGHKITRALASLAGSAALHVALVVIGLLVGGGDTGRREIVDQPIKIEVRERPPEPPPPPPEPVVEETIAEPATPEPPPPKTVKPPPVAAAPPPRVPPPEAEPPKTPPPRVVGLSLESTTEGGDGPAFAVGNTRAGNTAGKARDPNEVPAVGTGPADAPASPNAIATRIPVAGVKSTLPVRKVIRKPPYPETLKAQGVEADVTVLLNIDASGKVTRVKILKRAPYPELNVSAEGTARQEEFEPATRDGVPVPYILTFTYRFRLEEQ